MGARYQVVGAAVTAKVDTTDGVQVRYFYAGAVLPDGTHDDSIEHLLDVGLIAPFDAVEPAPVDGDGKLQEPARNASTEDWAAFALAKGATEADIDGLKRDDLVTKYGTPAA